MMVEWSFVMHDDQMFIRLGQSESNLAPMASTPSSSSAKQQVANLPAGMALVSSPRLPLFGIGQNDLPGLFHIL